MRAALLLPILASVTLRYAAPRLARRLPPATGTVLLSGLALVAALSSGFALTIAALLAVARLPHIAAMAQWSLRVVSSGDPVPLSAGLLAGAAVLVLLGAAARRGTRMAKDLAAAASACRRLGTTSGALVVLDNDVPDAYVLPGLSGRVVVSTAMLRALPSQERRALLAHESAHLQHHHHAYAQATELAAAANPFLRPVATAVRFTIERWADEVAAKTTGDRALTARALARAGLARHASTPQRGAAGSLALGAVDSVVADRARALLEPAPARARGLVALLLLAAGATACSSLVTAQQTEHRFELAHSAFPHSSSAPLQP